MTKNKMTALTFLALETIKKRCAFVIRMDMPLRTCRSILTCVLERRIEVESLQLQMIEGSESILLLHCRLERDRVRHLQQKLGKIDGALAVDLLENRRGNLR